jgi:hypothetical protein
MYIYLGVRLAWHIARICRRGMHVGFWWKSQKKPLRGLM